MFNNRKRDLAKFEKLLELDKQRETKPIQIDFNNLA